MKLIVGLGNPGLQYSKTRHNVGFLFLDYLQEQLSFPEFLEKSKFKAFISEGFIDGQKVILAKPNTFMNLSGEAILALVNFYNLDIKKDLCIVFDDIDLNFGKIRFKDDGGPGTHNGMRDIVLRIGSKSFARLRFGIEHEQRVMSLSDFVLSRFADEEFLELNKVFKEVFVLLSDKFLDFSKKTD
ncbi:aminoacyl-tRNA hydrolase [bacterium]|jgi:peptidyl-tRNA hydrolase, PTH1 family|nr:aminoacyl-tRNA hydrolase [bacterium]